MLGKTWKKLFVPCAVQCLRTLMSLCIRKLTFGTAGLGGRQVLGCKKTFFKHNSVRNLNFNFSWKRFVKADSLYKYNSTKTFDSKTELYWDEMEQIWFCKKVGKLSIEYLPLWKNFSILYHIHGILNLVLAGNSNVVEITKESCNYTKNLPLMFLILS